MIYVKSAHVRIKLAASRSAGGHCQTNGGAEPRSAGPAANSATVTRPRRCWLDRRLLSFRAQHGDGRQSVWTPAAEDSPPKGMADPAGKGSQPD